ncbi:MAG: septal ring lytic transglycosylase RlpA family protein [Cellvibrionaceae bacterium]|nr:septal ring lytic transglycosylase RlpA family protein [Cellvibrionaceae bacterium]
MKCLKWIIVMAILVPLAGCVTHMRPSSTTVVLKDGAPDEDMDVTHLADAIPREELIRNAGNKTPYTVLGKTYHVNFNTQGFAQTGYASWYGKKFHGNKTSNGEIYDMFAMTAAHKTLAIPSYVRVTNLENGHTAVVRVNDRGPFHDGRIIDLSYAAAKKLGFHNKGTAKVHVEVVAPNTPAPVQVASASAATAPVTPPPATGGAATLPAAAPGTPMTYLQLGAFSKHESASALVNKISAATGARVQVRQEPARSLYKVVIGPILDNFELLNLRQKLADAQFPEPHLVEF